MALQSCVSSSRILVVCEAMIKVLSPIAIDCIWTKVVDIGCSKMPCNL